MSFVNYSSHSSKVRGLAVLIGVALLMWGYIFWRNTQSAPVRQRIEAGAQFLQNGQQAAAKQQWREAVRLDPQNAPTWELLGDLYLKTQDYAAGLDAFRHALDNSSAPDLQARAAFCALQISDLSAARRYASGELKQNADDVTALQVLAEVEKRENHPDEQLKHLQRLVELQPQDVSALQDLAGEFARRDAFDKLLPLSKRLVEVEPDAATSYFLRGLALFNADSGEKNLPGAEADFKRSLELDPTDVEAHRFLARLYSRQNKPLQAIEHFEAIGKMRPYVSAHFLELSNAYRRAGKGRQANQVLALFTHLKQINRQMVSLVDRIELSPKNVENCLRMTKILLQCIDGQDADFQLFRYRYLNAQLQNVAVYSDKAVQIRPQDAATQLVARQVEASYARHLQTALRELEKRDYKAANSYMARAILVRPRDGRTVQAFAKFTAAQQDPLGALLPSSANSAFFD